MRKPYPGLGFVLCAAATWAALRQGLRATTGFVGARSPGQFRSLPQPAAVRRLAKKEEQDISFSINEQINALDVRLTTEMTDDPRAPEEEVNEVMSFTSALSRAKVKGLDLICINKEADPPICKIAKYSKFLYQESRKRKEQERKGKALKPKEVKISYTIGDHDLDVNIRKMEKWFKNAKQQVRVTVQLKGRTRMFGKNAIELLNRIRREVAGYGRATGTGDDPIKKDGRGDFYILFAAGADRAVLKELKEEALQSGVTLDAEDADDDEDEEEEEEEEDLSGTSAEIKALEEEIKEMREELRDCGISPGDIDRQPEIVDLKRELSKLKAAA